MSGSALLRRFEIRRAQGALRVFSAREDVKVRVLDVDDAYAAFAASALVDSEKSQQPQGAVLPEVDAFFADLVDGWTLSKASDHLALSGPDSMLLQAFADLLDAPRDVFNANATAMRLAGGGTKLTLCVGPLDDAATDGGVLPVTPFGAGAIVGPVRNDGRPCSACLERSVRMHDVHPTGVPSAAGARLLALRVLESLLTKPLLPYFSSYVLFRGPLDDRPAQNQAMRFTDCETCLRTRAAYPPRRLRDHHDDAVRTLRARGILA